MKTLVAQQPGGMKEFDPAAELHWPLLFVKVVDPGCTAELQIEGAMTGTVERLTTADSAALDRATFEEAVLRAFRREWGAFERGH